MPLNVYQRINEVRKLCAYIKKDKKVAGGRDYMAVTHDAVTAELRPQFIEQGIVVVPRLINGSVVDTGTTTKSGIPIIRYEAHYEIDFVNMDDPADRVTVPIAAHALDNGDKAPGKAASYATKYAMLKLFSIETGDSEEDRLGARAKAKDGSPKPSSNASPTTGARDNVSPEERKHIDELAGRCLDFLNGESETSVQDAVALADEAEMGVEEAVYFWTKFDSKQRSAMKAEGKARRQRALEVEAGGQA